MVAGVCPGGGGGGQAGAEGGAASKGHIGSCAVAGSASGDGCPKAGDAGSCCPGAADPKRGASGRPKDGAPGGPVDAAEKLGGPNGPGP